MNFGQILESLKKYDFSFFGIALVIFLVGAINLYSATHASDGTLGGLYKSQILYFFLSFLAGGLVSFIRPKNFYRFSYAFYFLCLILLVLVLVLGKEGMGAQRWLVLGPLRLQPSELTKVAVIFALARWFSRRGVDRDTGLAELFPPFVIAFVPAFLIILEPDLGTGLVVFLIFLVISFYRKLRWKTILLIAVLAAFSGLAMYKFGLKEYQQRRIITFLNPTADARGAGYNAIQSKIAIGSGQFLGKGFRKSSQASLNYLPENHTDFVFSIFNEEHGFAGALFLISLYLLLLFRFIWLASNVIAFYDSLLVVGIFGLFFWHTFINMGMVMGLLPIVGLPLPFMSYGGSGLLTFGICLGVATSISNARKFF